MPERAPEVEQVIREWLDAKRAADGARIRAGLSDYSGARFARTGTALRREAFTPLA